jgi:muramoyltetrapeptide carboxypeptidase LdcA involved in peptidoglycan recycling
MCGKDGIGAQNMKQLIKPYALQKNDLVATVSLSWGGAGLIPARYQQGKKQFEDAFGVKITEMPNALKSPDELYKNPNLRLDDFINAFKNPEVKAILTNIGGNDTIRLLRHMTEEHFDIIRGNPKIFMGMSDTTANHFMCYRAGLSSFYSPSLMFGYAENCGIPEYIKENTKKTLFDTKPIGTLAESKSFIVEHLDWFADTNNLKRARIPATPWRYIQGTMTVQGQLLGGCSELLNMLNGTSLWPKPKDWEDSILFIETSEEISPPSYIMYLLRNFAAQGILYRINGILFARPRGDIAKDEENKFDDTILKVCKESGRTDMPIVTNMNFGHTVPQFILPIGALTEINPIARTVSILEGAVR